MNKIKRIIELTDQIRAAKDNIELLEKERGLIEQALLDEWADDGIHSINMAGRNVHVRTDVYALTPNGMGAVADLLAGSEQYAHIVKPTVNNNTLSAIVRELTADGGELPDNWKGVIERGQRPAIRVTKA